jgi:hypothetical protein
VQIAEKARPTQLTRPEDLRFRSRDAYCFDVYAPPALDRVLADQVSFLRRHLLEA